MFVFYSATARRFDEDQNLISLVGNRPFMEGGTHDVYKYRAIGDFGRDPAVATDRLHSHPVVA
jgi:hypothetical protein